MATVTIPEQAEAKVEVHDAAAVHDPLSMTRCSAWGSSARGSPWNYWEG